MPEKDTYRRFEIHSRLLTQRIDSDHFILIRTLDAILIWYPSVIAGAESTIAGAELSIGGPRATPKVYKLTPMSSSQYVAVYLASDSRTLAEGGKGKLS